MNEYYKGLTSPLAITPAIASLIESISDVIIASCL
jgi:hypothetical protein